MIRKSREALDRLYQSLGSWQFVLVLFLAIVIATSSGIIASAIYGEYFVNSSTESRQDLALTEQSLRGVEGQTPNTIDSDDTDESEEQSVAQTPTGTKDTRPKVEENSNYTEHSAEEIPTSNNNDAPDGENPPQEEPETPSATVAFYADNQTDSIADEENHAQIVSYIMQTSANPIFHAGDLMEDGTQASLDSFNAVTSTLRSQRSFYSAIGNNDRKVGDSTTPSPLYLENFTYPNNELWYSVNVGNLHMIILDSAFSSASQAQIDWLVADLQSTASQSRITGVMFHHPTFFNTVLPYLRDYGADFAVSGHIHSYSKNEVDGVDQLTCQGQTNMGYFLAQVYEDRVELKVYNKTNSLLDSVIVDDRK